MLEYNNEKNQTVNPAPEPATQVLDPIVPTNKPKKKWWLWGLLVFVLVLLGSGAWWYYAQGQVLLMAKDMSWQWGTSVMDYKMTHNIKVDFSDTQASDFTLLSLQATSLDINAFAEISAKDFSGEAKIFSNSNEQSFEATLRYKKIADIFYLSGVLPENFATQVPFDVNNTWLAIDKGALEQENLLTAILQSSRVKIESLNSFNTKFSKFLGLTKERKLVVISDHHESKDWQGQKLKKISFSISPEKNEEVILAFWEAFGEPVETLQEKFLAKKNQNPESWQSLQDMLRQLNIDLWVDTDTKEIFGLEVHFDNFSFMQGEQKIADVNFHFTQMMEKIAKPAIEVPSEVLGVEELMQLLFEASGTNLAEGEFFDITSIFSIEDLMSSRGLRALQTSWSKFDGACKWCQTL